MFHEKKKEQGAEEEIQRKKSTSQLGRLKKKAWLGQDC